MQLIEHIKGQESIQEVLSSTDIAKKLARLNSKFEERHKRIEEYLSKVRTQFFRFYFVSDKDLLRIIGQGQNPRAIQKYITKLFAGIERMRVQEDTTKGVFKSKIQGVISQDGNELEEISFEKETVEIKRDQNVEVWLRKLEESIRKNMQAKLTS